MRPSATVIVNIYDECDVDSEVANVSIEAGDKIRWHSMGKSFVIEFEEDSSPFGQELSFSVTPDKDVELGPIKKGTPHASFHYSIRRADNSSIQSDPDVNVKR